MTQKQAAQAVPEAPAEVSVAGPRIKWEDSRMVSTYANVANVAMTSEEIMVLFGTSQVWSNTQEEIEVQLSNRIIMTPSAAKRLLALLSKSLSDYEKLTGKTG